MRDAIYLVSESWRQAYGQLVTQRPMPSGAALLYKLPNGDSLTLEGWRKETRHGEAVYIGPDGEEFLSLDYAAQALELEKKGSQGAHGSTFHALTKMMNEFKEGHAEDRVEPGGEESQGAGAEAPEAPPRPAPAAPSCDARTATYRTSSQLDDWHHRGEHPLVRHMGLRVYSMWVYRTEVPLQRTSGLEPSTVPVSAFVDIPFDDAYPHRHAFAQRISAEPRIPRPEGMQFVAASQDPERHYTLKSLLLQPLRQLSHSDSTATRKAVLLEAYKQFCSPAESGDEVWPAQNGGPGSPGPFQRSYEAFFARVQQSAAEGRRKLAVARRAASLWETVKMQAVLDELAQAKLMCALL